MITSVYKAITRLKQDVSCSGIIQTWVDGENVETYTNEGVRSVAVLPLSAEFLKYQTEGVYTHKDVRVFEEITYDPLPLRSLIIKSDNTLYRINENDDRGFEGRYRRYLAKKIEGTP